MPLYRAVAHKRYDPARKTAIFVTVRARNVQEAEEKLAARDLVDVKLEQIKGVSALSRMWKADIK